MHVRDRKFVSIAPASPDNGYRGGDARGNCHDNAMVETFFKTMKSELVWRTVFDTRTDAARMIGGYIDRFYNPARRHSTLAFMSPVQYEMTVTK